MAIRRAGSVRHAGRELRRASPPPFCCLLAHFPPDFLLVLYQAGFGFSVRSAAGSVRKRLKICSLTIFCSYVTDRSSFGLSNRGPVRQNVETPGGVARYVRACIEHGEQAQRSNGAPVACFHGQAVQNAG